MVRMQTGDSFAKKELEEFEWDYTGKPAMSFGEIGVILGLNRKRVQYIHDKIIAALRAELAGMGYPL